MKNCLTLLLFALLLPFYMTAQNSNDAVSKLINDWHKAAAEADFNGYFSKMHRNAVYMGTDATERWNKTDFMSYSKPYFDKGKAWDFKTLKRNITFSKDKKTAWIDELLDTQMKICRGSGVLIYEKKQWKIIQYVLSMTVPNDKTPEVIKLKKEEEDQLINRFISK